MRVEVVDYFPGLHIRHAKCPGCLGISRLLHNLSDRSGQVAAIATAEAGRAKTEERNDGQQAFEDARAHHGRFISLRFRVLVHMLRVSTLLSGFYIYYISNWDADTFTYRFESRVGHCTRAPARRRKMRSSLPSVEPLDSPAVFCMLILMRAYCRLFKTRAVCVNAPVKGICAGGRSAMVVPNRDDWKD